MYVAMRQGCCTLERLVHMMGLVLTLLYLIGGLGAVVWFVVSHKDEEEVSVDERLEAMRGALAVMGGCLVLSFTGLLTSLLLVVGVKTEQRMLLLPWQIFHAGMVLTCLGGALYQSLHFTVLAERQDRLRACLALFPAVAGVLFIFLWLIVSQLATKLSYRRRLDKVLEEKRASLATLHTSLPRPLPKEKPGAHRGARSVRSLKRRKAGGGGATSGEEYEALRTRSRSMEHILQPAGEQRMGAGMDNPNYWVQPYSRSRSLPRHLERGERWEEEGAWEGGNQKRRASREDLGRTWREEPAWSSGRGEEQLHRSWREELEERSARAEMERSWKMRRRTAETSRTPQPGRKSSDSSTPDTVQSSLHSLASGKSVTIANTVEIIPRASLANSRSRREGEVSVNNVKIGRGEGLSQGLREVGASQTLGRVGLSLGREVVTSQGKEGVTLGRGVRLGRQEETRNFLSDTETSEVSPSVPAPVYPTLPLRKERSKEPMTRHQIIDLYCKN